MNMVALKHGCDGQPTTIEPVRDPDGEGKREIFVETRYDVVGRLFRAKTIESHHEVAARRLQLDAERAELMAKSHLGSIRTERSRFATSDTQDKAMSRHYDAKRAVDLAMGRAGTRGGALIELVVIQNMQLHDAGRVMHIEGRSVAECLRFALDTLARHYGLC